MPAPGYLFRFLPNIWSASFYYHLILCLFIFSVFLCVYTLGAGGAVTGQNEG